jgi:glycosyltransferase involved in cell wall biosynthesis
MEDSKVSIIIPTFNYGHLIAETLNCLLVQTYQIWEAIIIDDGSSDHTEEIVSTFVKRDNRFSYIKQTNRGVASARNAGLKLASGSYIQFLDADDLISKEKISRQVDFLTSHQDVDICVSATKFFESHNKDISFTDINLKNKTVMQTVNGSGYLVISDFIQRNLLVIQSPLFRKNILNRIGYFKEGMHYLEDWDFWFRATTANLRFGFLNNELVFGLVRVHEGSATQQSSKIIEAELSLRDLIKENISRADLNISQKETLLIKNDRERINIYKKLMAQTPLTKIKKFIRYYKEIKNTGTFLKAFIKALNLRRKVNRF